MFGFSNQPVKNRNTPGSRSIKAHHYGGKNGRRFIVEGEMENLPKGKKKISLVVDVYTDNAKSSLVRVGGGLEDEQTTGELLEDRVVSIKVIYQKHANGVVDTRSPRYIEFSVEPDSASKAAGRIGYGLKEGTVNLGIDDTSETFLLSRSEGLIADLTGASLLGTEREDVLTTYSAAARKRGRQFILEPV